MFHFGFVYDDREWGKKRMRKKNEEFDGKTFAILVS